MRNFITWLKRVTHWTRPFRPGDYYINEKGQKIVLTKWDLEDLDR